MEFAMNDQPRMPAPEVDKRLLGNMRQSRLRVEEAMLELEDITAKLEHDIRQKRLMRVRHLLNGYEGESHNSE